MGASTAIYAEPVRGVGAIKGLYAKGNRKRLYVYVGVGLALFAAIIYTFVSAENPANKQGGGETHAGARLAGSTTTERSIIDKEEAERYNREQLEREQESNIYAHPLITTNVEGADEEEDDYSPFETKADLKTPDRLSETGQTQQQTGGSKGQQEYYDEDAYRSADDLARILIQGEAVVPQVQTVSWSYVQPKRRQETPLAAGGQANDPELESGMNSCATTLARAGSTAMATVDLALNSDVGGPASLTIRNGKMRGYRLIGSFERKEEWLRLMMNKLVTPQETLSVSAIGLDIDTTMNAVQGDVNRHMMYRYGWWGVGTVLSAIGKASAANASNATYVSDGVVVESTTQDSKRELKMALGDLGEDIGSIMRDRINRPITVTLNVDDEVGVFFLDDVCLETAVN
jgi:hypothetical protein